MSVAVITLLTKLFMIRVITQLFEIAAALSVTSGHCYKNVSVRYQVPVTRTRQRVQSASGELLLEQYIELEDRYRVDRMRVCCTGYRSILFGLCAPICTQPCPEHSYCSEPNKCVCARGYEEHRVHYDQSPGRGADGVSMSLHCRPVCKGGCPSAHSHCVGRNRCACNPGYKDISSWFSPLRCKRIQCPEDQVYNVLERQCIKVDINLEQLMQQVAKKLAHGLNDHGDYDDYDEETTNLNVKKN